MCNRSIPTGIGSLPEKPPSDSILSRARSVHTNAPSCCYGSCRLTLLTDITCPASAIIGCYLWRQTALSLWIQSCGYNCAAFHSGFPTYDIRSERTRDFQTAQMPLVSFYWRCHQWSQSSLSVSSVSVVNIQSVRQLSWFRKGLSSLHLRM